MCNPFRVLDNEDYASSLISKTQTERHLIHDNDNGILLCSVHPSIQVSIQTTRPSEKIIPVSNQQDQASHGGQFESHL
jgi:hypothetical protein